jgi:hypothetical protein
MEDYVTEAAQFMRLAKYCQGNGHGHTVLSRMEERRHAYVGLTGNVHEEDQCEDVMTVGLGVRDCEDDGRSPKTL